MEKSPEKGHTFHQSLRDRDVIKQKHQLRLEQSNMEEELLSPSPGKSKRAGVPSIAELLVKFIDKANLLYLQDKHHRVSKRSQVLAKRKRKRTPVPDATEEKLQQMKFLQRETIIEAEQQNSTAVLCQCSRSPTKNSNRKPVIRLNHNVRTRSSTFSMIAEVEEQSVSSSLLHPRKKPSIHPLEQIQEVQQIQERVEQKPLKIDSEEIVEVDKSLNASFDNRSTCGGETEVRNTQADEAVQPAVPNTTNMWYVVAALVTSSDQYGNRAYYFLG